jgi:hypothetical protein
VVAIWYPCYLLATFLVVSLPVILSNWRLEEAAMWEVGLFGVIPQSAELTDWLSNRRWLILVWSCGVLGTLSFLVGFVLIRARIVGAVLLSATALLFMSYWVAMAKLEPLMSIPGVLLSFTSAAYSQRLLLHSEDAGILERFLQVWCGSAVGCALTSLIAFGGVGWVVGLSGITILALSGIAASMPFATPKVEIHQPSTLLLASLGVVVSLTGVQTLRMGGPWLAEHRHRATLNQLLTTTAPAVGEPYSRNVFQRGVNLVADRASFGSDRTHKILTELVVCFKQSACYSVRSVPA